MEEVLPSPKIILFVKRSLILPIRGETREGPSHSPPFSGQVERPGRPRWNVCSSVGQPAMQAHPSSLSGYAFYSQA